MKLLCIALVFTQVVCQEELLTVRAGFMFPNDLGKITTKNIGFAQTAGAVKLAIDKIEADQLLPNVNWT
jgi:hypothetical protein